MRKIFYRLQYNTGELSCVVNESRDMMYAFADCLKNNKNHYPVCIWRIKLKEEA